jgi:hypothetical protein
MGRVVENMSERLLNAAEVADLLSVPESWVRQQTREEAHPALATRQIRSLRGGSRDRVA